MLKCDRNHIVRVVGNVELFWFVYNFLSVLEIKLRASYMLGKHLVTELYIVLVYSLFAVFWWWWLLSSLFLFLPFVLFIQMGNLYEGLWNGKEILPDVFFNVVSGYLMLQRLFLTLFLNFLRH